MDQESTIKLLKDQISQMTSSTYDNYKRIAELREENNYLRERVKHLENKLEQVSNRKLNGS
jgi:archaellum component FlaC|tara:strand:- start:406 stop:588 length:183 start_codon:yes stop_codon:yes gene_type:complete